jgi:hypothetical protein
MTTTLKNRPVPHETTVTAKAPIAENKRVQLCPD